MSEVKWVLLIATDQITADIYQSMLESSDIPALQRSDITHSVHPFTIGDVEVLVPEENLEEAKELIENVEIVIEDEEEKGKNCGDCSNCSEDCPLAEEE